MMLSVRLQCYNHGLYIQQALESVIMQQTNFPFEVVIGDDFSTDDSLAIIDAVIAKNTNTQITFHVLDRPVGGTYWKDRQKLGRLHNFANIIDNCQGKYIALLDGDDYWTDPLKLQKQVDFLEGNSNYGICFHNVEQLNLLHTTERTIIPGVLIDTNYTLYDYIQANKTASCSIVYRRTLFDTIPDWFVNLPFGDLGLVLSVLKNSENKKGHVLYDTMAVYRLHDAGLHGSLHKTNKGLILAYKQYLQFINLIEKRLLHAPEYKLALDENKVKIYAKLSDLTKRERNLLQFVNYKLHWYYKLTYLKLHF
ncbi:MULTISPECIES: glycosyltransferase family 2 protein [Bizionia]|uniref:Glycosyltransferase n=1 Tax=Bizionia algoritergicola TaxID=291187 RepID=A0A5D0QRV5_9FLAO|nr:MULTISPECIES: glycosyltransferase [Bizionia]OBX23243.1 hypothetical protein BAA08_05470 [Bizionia sp. APA-3]TYB71616.1 glycosyltransferase [Bizionia algoritergicola]